MTEPTTPQPSPASLSRQALIEHRLVYQDQYGGTCACGESFGWYDRPVYEVLGIHIKAALAALDAPQGGDEARLTEAEQRVLEGRLACLEAWPNAWNGDYNPACCRFPKSCSIDDDPRADRLAAPRDQTEDTLAERVRALAGEWQTNANALLKQGVIERSVRSTMVGCALALRALLADQPDATASDRPAWVAAEFRHADGRLCWFNAQNGGWYTEEDRPGHLAPGGRPVCDDEHPDATASECACGCPPEDHIGDIGCRCDVRCDGTPQSCPFDMCNGPVKCGACCSCLGECELKPPPTASEEDQR